MRNKNLSKSQDHPSLVHIWTKRAFDFVSALLLLALLSPLMLAVALAVLLVAGWPVIFSQVRAGQHGRLFTVYKFRTMTDARAPGGAPLPDAQRLTPLGYFLRKASLDELPQLWNVLKGDMSLVGPRPLLPQYTERYTPHQARRLEVRPGMTGWAQVKGRNAITWEQKFDLDVWYVDHYSLLFDLRILCLTLVKMLLREHISQAGHATVQPFTGSLSSSSSPRSDKP